MECQRSEFFPKGEGFAPHEALAPRVRPHGPGGADGADGSGDNWESRPSRCTPGPSRRALQFECICDRDRVGQVQCWGGPWEARGGEVREVLWQAPFAPYPLSQTPYPHLQEKNITTSTLALDVVQKESFESEGSAPHQAPPRRRAI
eukprot:gene10223-biopygen12295